MRTRPATLVTIAAVVLTLAPVGVAVARADSAGAAPHRSGGVLRAALAAAAQAPTPAPAPPPPPVLLPHPAVLPDLYVWPANGPITSPFGRRWGRAHQGVDIDAPTGSAVVASQAGTVVRASWYYGYGNSVLIDHGFGIVTHYAHLSGLAVGLGQHVPQGHYLGPVGATGSVTAAHLHYEVHVNGAPVNPMPWL